MPKRIRAAALARRGRTVAWRHLLALWGAVLLGWVVPHAAAGRAIPPPPFDYVLDEMGWLSADQHQLLVTRLQDWERRSSNQIVVAIFRTLDGADLADFNNRVANAWGIGHAGRDNGILLAVYGTERKIAIEVGYGLEGRITDLVSDLIIREQLTPAFARGEYAAGIVAAVDALMAASRGEYRGTGKTEADRLRPLHDPKLVWIALILLLILAGAGRRRRAYGPMVLGPWLGPGGIGWGGSRGYGADTRRMGGGVRMGGGGGTFRGGGGHFGGGGARGGW